MPISHRDVHYLLTCQNKAGQVCSVNCCCHCCGNQRCEGLKETCEQEPKAEMDLQESVDLLALFISLSDCRGTS